MLVGALRVAEWEARSQRGLDENPTRMLVVAMGRWGGREMGYSSDADVLFVHDPLPGADQRARAGVRARRSRRRCARCSARVGPEPALEVDADLRPEGRNGPMVRSFDSYAEYYDRWSSPWESQALLRARPVAGDAELGERFVELIAPLRYPEGGVDPSVEREIRRIKARVESERLPRGVEPARHLKLGRGGISDVEWTAQLLQLQHAHDVPGLRTTGTLEALEAAAGAGLLDADDAQVLAEAWQLASRLRDANVLWTGRGGAHADLLPHDRQALAGLARVARVSRRLGRRARAGLPADRAPSSAVVERVFYG